MKVYQSNFMIHLPVSEENQHGARPGAGQHEALRGVAGRRLSGLPGTISTNSLTLISAVLNDIVPSFEYS